ncbi:MAG: GNAT family N-acetyltransferase [Pseudorhodobacter sp.]
MRIRPYRPGDRAACHEIFFHAVREGAAPYYDRAQRCAWAPANTPAPDTPDKLLDQTCWVAEISGNPAGFMSLTGTGHIDMAFVLPHLRGKGVAAALYDRLLDHGRAVSLPRLTSHASHLFQRFLLRRGWRIDHAETVTPNGIALERFHMTLDPLS